MTPCIVRTHGFLMFNMKEIFSTGTLSNRQTLEGNQLTVNRGEGHPSIFQTYL